MKTSGKKLSRLAEVMTSYPQVLKNVMVKEKRPIDKMPKVVEKIKAVEEKLGSEGRVLVRYSGTSRKCRVMLEGEDEEEITKMCDSIISVIKKEIGE